MLKSIALYRDGSKLSQPLSALMPGSDAAAAAVLSIMKETGKEGIGLALSPTERGKKRNPLPAKRFGYTQKAKIGGHSIFVRGPDNMRMGRWGRYSLTCTRKARPSAPC